MAGMALPLVVDAWEPGHQISISAQCAPQRGQGSRFAPTGAPGASRPGIIRIERVFAKPVPGTFFVSLDQSKGSRGIRSF